MYAAPLYCHLTDAYLSSALDFIGVELLAVNGDLDELGNSRKVVVLSGVFLDLSWICVIPGSGRDWPEGPWASTSWSDLGRIVQVHFSFAGIVWVMVLFLLPVVFQTKVARLTALVYFPGMVPQGRKKDAASLLRWFLNEEMGCTMWPAELL